MQYHMHALTLNPNNPEHITDMGGLLDILWQGGRRSCMAGKGQAH